MEVKRYDEFEDIVFNELAVKVAKGDAEACEEFARLLQPKMKKHARRKFVGDMPKDDLEQEFMIKAIEVAKVYHERYDGNGNYLQVLYFALDNLVKDLGRMAKAQKRARVIEVDGVPFNRELPLDALLEDDENPLHDRVVVEEKELVDIIAENLGDSPIEKALRKFIEVANGRNRNIMLLVYEAGKQDWDYEELHEKIAEVLKAEKGIEPKRTAVRKAKQRAIEAFKKEVDWNLIKK